MNFKYILSILALTSGFCLVAMDHPQETIIFENPVFTNDSNKEFAPVLFKEPKAPELVNDDLPALFPNTTIEGQNSSSAAALLASLHEELKPNATAQNQPETTSAVEDKIVAAIKKRRRKKDIEGFRQVKGRYRKPQAWSSMRAVYMLTPTAPSLNNTTEKPLDQQAMIQIMNGAEKLKIIESGKTKPKPWSDALTKFQNSGHEKFNKKKTDRKKK